MDIINIKHTKTIVNKVAYCGLNYNYWRSKFPIMNHMADFSILGKPKHLIVRGNRPQTCSNYKAYLIKRLNEPAILSALHKLKGYDALACWCAPLQCHCEVIRDIIDTL